MLGKDGVKVVRVDDVRLRIYEPPRFFEAFLRGRGYREPVDITARICGICPVAYQMSSIAAMEDVCGVEVPEPVRALEQALQLGQAFRVGVQALVVGAEEGADVAQLLARCAPRYPSRRRAFLLSKEGTSKSAIAEYHEERLALSKFNVAAILRDEGLSQRLRELGGS